MSGRFIGFEELEQATGNQEVAVLVAWQLELARLIVPCWSEVHWDNYQRLKRYFASRLVAGEYPKGVDFGPCVPVKSRIRLNPRSRSRSP